MCGIVAGVSSDRPSDQVVELLQKQLHRGPDGNGMYSIDNLSVGMCRLRVRDGHEIEVPLRSLEQGAVAYNGELYKYSDSDGVQVPRDCYEEVAAIERWMQGEVQSMDGMYAAIVVSQQGLEIVRDAWGIKPLFHLQGPPGTCFLASEVQALRHLNNSLFRIDTLVELLAFGKVLGGRTAFEGIDEVPAGAKSSISCRGVLKTEQVWDPYRPTASSSAEDPYDAIRNAVLSCLPSRRKIGLCLSGGLDSTILASVLNDIGVEDLVTISVTPAFSDDGVRDLAELGLPSPGAWQSWQHVHRDLPAYQPQDLADRTAGVYGQPTRMTSVVPYAEIAALAAQAGVVVLLCGEGADELFLGYPEYASLGRGDGNVSDKLLDFYLPSARRARLVELFGESEVNRCEGRFKALYAPLHDGDFIAGLRQTERELRLEPLLARTDVCLMQKSIEGRTPFLHGNVAACALSSSNRLGEKNVLRERWREQFDTSVSGRPKCHFRSSLEKTPEGFQLEGIVSKLNDMRSEVGMKPIEQAALERLNRAILAGDQASVQLGYILRSIGKFLPEDS